jgi:hypothetical protein
LPNVRFATGVAVRELDCHNQRVHGVRCSDSRSLEADLIVDAGGRGSRVPKWLAAMGSAQPDETTIGVNRRDLSLSLYWRSRRGLPTGPQLAATRRGTGPPQVLTKKIGAQGAVGCSRRVGSVRQAYQRPVRTALGKVQGARGNSRLYRDQEVTLRAASGRLGVLFWRMRFFRWVDALFLREWHLRRPDYIRRRLPAEQFLATISFRKVPMYSKGSKGLPPKLFARSS